MTTLPLPRHERRILTDSLTVPGYVVTVTRCLWTDRLLEMPHWRIQVDRADGVPRFVTTLPAGTSQDAALWIARMHLQVTATVDRSHNERRAA